MTNQTIPTYSQLPTIEQTGEHHSWKVFGEHDELGTMNFIGPEQVRAALQCATEGRVINLDLPLNLPSPALGSTRSGYKHHIRREQFGSDDHVDGFFLQSSSQWDALAHIRYREFGFYGGRQDIDLDQGELGIDRLARKGIVGRGVLVDFPRYHEEMGTPADPNSRIPLGPKEFDSILAWSGVKLKQGDILLLRSGWLRWYLNLDQAGREKVGGTLHNREGGMDCPGFAPTVEMAEWLWNNQIAAVASDNPALEVLKVRKEEGFLHRRIMALLGMPIGELWYLEELSHVCHDRGRSDFFLTSSPINLPKGAGSPANAYAIL